MNQDNILLESVWKTLAPCAMCSGLTCHVRWTHVQCAVDSRAMCGGLTCNVRWTHVQCAVDSRAMCGGLTWPGDIMHMIDTRKNK